MALSLFFEDLGGGGEALTICSPPVLFFFLYMEVSLHTPIALFFKGQEQSIVAQ